MTTSTGAESPLYRKTQPPHRPGTTAEFFRILLEGSKR